MADQALKNAQALRDRIVQRLKVIDAERASLEKQLADVTTFLRAAEQYASLAPGEAPPSVVTTPSLREVTGKRPRNPRREDVLETVAQALTSAGRPMQLRELYDLVTGQGVVLNGTDPVAVLGTMLWRGGQEGVLVNLKPHGYWPAHLPYSPAGYEPKQ